MYDPHKHHPPKGEPWRTGRRSIRLKEYDYSGSGGYFVTICVRKVGAIPRLKQDLGHELPLPELPLLFGEIVDSEMKVNQY